MRGYRYSSLVVIAVVALASARCAPDTPEEVEARRQVVRARVRATVDESAHKVESLGAQRAEAIVAGSTRGVTTPRIAYLPAPPETVYVDTSRVDTVRVPYPDTVRVRARPATVARSDTATHPPRDFGLRPIEDRRPPITTSLVEERKKWCVAASVGYGARVGDRNDRFGLFVGPTVSRELVCF